VIGGKKGPAPLTAPSGERVGPAEELELSARLTKCGIEIDECRAWWAHADRSGSATTQQVFDEYWFGAKSLARIEVLIRTLRLRFDAFPNALQTLHRWPHMSAETRRLICHWHLQLADPLYRTFSGEFLPERRNLPTCDVTRSLAVAWVGRQTGEAWRLPTRTQFATNALSAAVSAGLVTGKRDPRPVVLPAVPGEALGYILHLLREIQFRGTLLDNPYLASVGLVGPALVDRLRSLPGIQLRRQADLADFSWDFADLESWRREVVGDAPNCAVASGGAA
jgi:hypothetical protein